MNSAQLNQTLDDFAPYLLQHQAKKITSNQVTQPSLHNLIETFRYSDRSDAVLANLKRLFNHGRLGGTGYLSLLAIDQGIEHGAAYSFARNPELFDPENIIKLAIAGKTNGVTTTTGALGLISKKYAHQIPVIAKLTHNELLTYPPKYDQIYFASVEQAANLGAAGVGATIYFGSPESNRQIQETAKAFAKAHELGLFTMLWCYPRNPDFKKTDQNYESAVDITSQAIHLGVTLGADIIKQKMPNSLRGFQDLDFPKKTEEMYDNLITEHPIDLVRFQVAHAFAGKIPLINSGGPSSGQSGDDLHELVKEAVINKRAGGWGMVTGRKVYKREFGEAVKYLEAIQDVYLDESVGLA